MKNIKTVIMTVVAVIFVFWLSFKLITDKNILPLDNITLNQNYSVLATPSPTSTPTPSPTPSPSPLTFAQMNELYGPCIHVPVIMYHHIQNMQQAEAEKHASLTVSTDIFQQQMQYLKDRGYNIITAQDLINFFDNSTGLAAKPVMLTFDDAYKDFITDALPILKQFSYPAILFTPTGLVDNPGYANWNDLTDASISKILISNHTWSHHNMAGASDVISKEISTADEQLTAHNFNFPKVFSYPYGFESASAINFLTSKGYQLAFTTKPGSIQCKKLRLELFRIRVGNSSLSAYGF